MKRAIQEKIQPYVMPSLPTTDWERDLMLEMNFIVCSPNKVVAKQMLEQGFLPGQGLVKEGKVIKRCENPMLKVLTLKIEAWGIFHNGHYLACNPC